MTSDQFDHVRSRFEDLTDDAEEVRLQASLAIITGLGDAPAPPLRKALARLLRGLASGRKSARLGFSITLTELLWNAVDGDSGSEGRISLAEVLTILQSSTKPEGKVSGQEERDHHLGRLFGLEALLKSAVLFRPSSSHSDASEVVQLVFELARKKPWLREEAGWILFQALDEAAKHQASGWFGEILLRELDAATLTKTPEAVAVWLLLRDLAPTLILPHRPWRHSDPLHPDNLTLLAKVLKESSSPEDGEAAEDAAHVQTGAWHSKPHFVWDVIFGILFREPLKDGNLINFERFWRHAVDENLFSASASRERKYWGFMLFSKAFAQAPDEYVSALFSSNFLRCLINHLSQEDRYLHRSAHRTLKDMQKRVDANPHLAYHALAGLTKAGSPNFDQASKTKTVQGLIARVEKEDVPRVQTLFLQSMVEPGSSDERAAEQARQLLADYLVILLRSRKGGLEHQLFQPMHTSMACLGYLGTGTSSTPLPPLSQASRAQLRQRLSTGFTHILSNPTDPGIDQPYQTIRELARIIERLDPSSLPATELRRMRDILKHVPSLAQLSSSKSMHTVAAFRLLYSLVVFQALEGEVDSDNILAELDRCRADLLAQGGSDTKSLSVVLLEILLSLLSKKSALLRKLSQTVFVAIAGDLKSNALQILFDVLETKESLAGQEALFDEVDDEVDEGDDVSMVEDIQEVTEAMENSAGSDSDLSTSQPDSDAEESAMDADGDDELHRLNAALGEIVGTRPLRDGDGLNAGESSSEEAMDDEAMFKLDAQVAQVFKERKKSGSKKEQKLAAKESVINLKNRVLDLLDAYVKGQHRRPLSLRVLLPLLRVGRESSSKQVSDKARAVLRDFAHKCRGKDVPQLKNRRRAWALLDEIHDEAARDSSRAHASGCSQASLIVSKALVGLEPQNIERVIARYGRTQGEWVSGRCGTQVGFFSDFLHWCTSIRQQRR